MPEFTDKDTRDQLEALTRKKNSGLLNKAIASGKTDQTPSGKHKWFWVAPQDTTNHLSQRPQREH